MSRAEVTIWAHIKRLNNSHIISKISGSNINLTGRASSEIMRVIVAHRDVCCCVLYYELMEEGEMCKKVLLIMNKFNPNDGRPRKIKISVSCVYFIFHPSLTLISRHFHILPQF
jgi:hypothetical protein